MSLDEREDYYLQKGEYSLKAVNILESIKYKKTGKYQEVLKVHLTITQNYFHYLGQEIDQVDGTDLEACMFHELHNALACYRLSENTSGLNEAKRLMETKGIEHDSEYETVLIRHLLQISDNTILMEKEIMALDYRDS